MRIVKGIICIGHWSLESFCVNFWDFDDDEYQEVCTEKDDGYFCSGRNEHRNEIVTLISTTRKIVIGLNNNDDDSVFITAG